MIAHFSIPSKTPKETALFFASLIDGVVFDFPVVPGASVAVSKDGSGVAVEVYPIDMAHHPGTGAVDNSIVPEGPMAMPWEDQIFAEPGNGSGSSGFHLAMSTQISEDEVIKRAEDMGWRAISCERGGVFGLVEVWVDNAFLVEVLVPREVERYRAFMNPEGCAAMFGQPVSPKPIG